MAGLRGHNERSEVANYAVLKPLRRGCSLRAIKITVASKIACFRSSVMESPQFRIEVHQRQAGVSP